MITEEMKERLKALGPEAVDVMGEMLRDQDTPPMARVHIIDVVLEYTLGKPEMAVKISQEPGMPESTGRIGTLMGMMRMELKDREILGLEEAAEAEEEEEEDGETEEGTEGGSDVSE